MTEATKKTETKPATPKAALKSAAAASDPAVHQLLAHMQTARLNGDRDRLGELTRQLADLGYE